MAQRFMRVEMLVRAVAIQGKSSAWRWCLSWTCGWACRSGSCWCSCAWCSVRCSQTPVAINPAAGRVRRRRLAEQGDAECGANERRRREIRAGARRAQFAQGQHEEHQTGAIAKAADRHRGRRLRHGGQGMAQQQGQAEVHRARDKALGRRDEHRIGGGYLARQVVVDGPAQAGASMASGPPRWVTPVSPAGQERVTLPTTIRAIPATILIRETLGELRDLQFELSPPALYLGGLSQALESLAAHSQARFGVAIEYHPSGEIPPLPQDLAVVLSNASGNSSIT